MRNVHVIFEVFKITDTLMAEPEHQENLKPEPEEAEGKEEIRSKSVYLQNHQKTQKSLETWAIHPY